MIPFCATTSIQRATLHMLVAFVEGIGKPITLIVFAQPYSISHNVTTCRVVNNFVITKIGKIGA